MSAEQREVSAPLSVTRYRQYRFLRSGTAMKTETPLDLPETVDVEQVAQAVDVICGMALEMMSTDTPSMMAKAHSYNDRDYAFVQKKDTPAWFGESPEFVQAETGRTGILNGINTDASGRQVEKYQFRMKWFDVDQIILTDYYFTDGGLSLISVEGGRGRH